MELYSICIAALSALLIYGFECVCGSFLVLNLLVLFFYRIIMQCVFGCRESVGIGKLMQKRY